MEHYLKNYPPTTKPWRARRRGWLARAAAGGRLPLMDSLHGRTHRRRDSVSHAPLPCKCAMVCGLFIQRPPMLEPKRPQAATTLARYPERRKTKDIIPWGGCTYPEDDLYEGDYLYTPPQLLDFVSEQLPQVLSPARPSVVTHRLPWRESQVRHLASPARGNDHTQTNIIPRNANRNYPRMQRHLPNNP